MSAFDWVTGGLQDVVDLLGSANVSIEGDLPADGPGTPNPSNPGSISNVIAAAVQRDGYKADALFYDAIRGGLANVTCPFTVNGVALASLSASDETRVLVAYYSAKKVAKLLNEHRMLQSLTGQQADVDKIAKAWDADTDKWLMLVREGEAGTLLDRTAVSGASVSSTGALSVAVKSPTQYPGTGFVRPPSLTLPTPAGPWGW